MVPPFTVILFRRVMLLHDDPAITGWLSGGGATPPQEDGYLSIRTIHTSCCYSPTGVLLKLGVKTCRNVFDES